MESGSVFQITADRKKNELVDREVLTGGSIRLEGFRVQWECRAYAKGKRHSSMGLGRSWRSWWNRERLAISRRQRRDGQSRDLRRVDLGGIPGRAYQSTDDTRL